MHDLNTFLGKQYAILPIHMSMHTQTDRQAHKSENSISARLGGYNKQLSNVKTVVAVCYCKHLEALKLLLHSDLSAMWIRLRDCSDVENN